MKFRAFVIVLACTLVIPSLSFAQPARPKGAFANVQEAAVAGDTSGVEVEAGGGGIFVLRVEVDTADVYGITISGASLFDSSVAVIAPLFIFGSGTLASIVREGVDSAGAVPSEGHLLILGTTVVDFSAYPIFVPSGSFFTVRRTTVNNAANVTVGFVEIP